MEHPDLTSKNKESPTPKQLEKYCALIDQDAKAAAIMYARTTQTNDNPEIIAGTAFIAGAAWLMERVPQIISVIKSITKDND